MLMPKRVKYRKLQRGRMGGKAVRGSQVSFGDYGLQATECGWITARHIEAARIAMTRYVKRGGKIWIRVFSPQVCDQETCGNANGQGQGGA
jgi:large subunit ribosomal protein L16